MTGTYNTSLVGLSLLVAILASYTALDLSGRVSEATSRGKARLWLFGGAFAMGTGIWAMHFIGMLAYELPMEINYDPLLTLASEVFAVLLSGLALWMISLGSMSAGRIVGGGILMAGGICGMHYTGMAAMKMQPPIEYDPVLLGASVLIALGASMTALWLCFALRQATSVRVVVFRFGAAVAMGCAVAGMHYTGMAAARFEPDALCGVGASFAVNTQGLGFSIAAIMVVFMTSTIVVSAIQSARFQALQSMASRLEVSNAGLAEARDNARLAESEALAKTAFLANMSHEIRSPMNAVMGFSQLLAQTELSSEQREFVDSIQISGDHLLTVINDILDLSRISAGGMELEYLPFNPRKLVEGALQLVSGVAADKGLELMYVADVQLPPQVLGDESRLRQILVNLLANAVKFTERGEIVVSLASKAAEADGYLPPGGTTPLQLYFEVRDTGIGIAPDRLPQLFEQYRQADVSTARQFGGTGLGLAISRSLAELHGGTIGVRSTPGAGTTFSIEVRVALPTESHSRQPDSGIRLLDGKRALIVDDNPSSLSMLSGLFSGFGMNTVALADPREVVAEVAGHSPFDLILLDQYMPELGGIELAQQLVGLPTVEASKMVLLGDVDFSTRADPEVGQLFDTVFHKPLRQSELLERTAAVLGLISIAIENSTVVADAALPPMKILLAEDNPMNQRVATLTLAAMGLGADVVENGEQAVRAVENQRYDVVLMDMQMPFMGGLDATREIRALGTNIVQPRVIALTANAMHEDRSACFEAGMDGFVSKPMDRQLLEKELRLVKTSGEATGGGVSKIGPVLESAALLPDPTGNGPTGYAAPEGDMAEIARAARVEMEARFGLGPFKGLVEIFLRTTPGMVDDMQQAFQAGDLPNVCAVAHVLRSNMAHFGASGLSARFAEIEHLSRSGSAEALGPLVPIAMTQYRQFYEAIDGLSPDQAKS